MTRGKPSTIGETRWSPNGYHYTRTANGWELTHRLLAEETLCRPLAENERIRFKDNDRTNLTHENIEVYIVRERSKAKRIAHLEHRIAELQAELEELRVS